MKKAIRRWAAREFPAARKRRRATKTAVMTWLRGLTFADVYGQERVVDGGRQVRPSHTKEGYVFRKNGRRYVRRLANYEFRDHFDRKATYYFFGSPDNSATLVMLDIDVGKAMGRGTTEGAWKFTEHLKKFWPTMYFESSTGGKGVHGYLVLEKRGHDAADVNSFLKRLQDWLRDEAEAVHADIELVEVKGTCPVVHTEGDKITAVKYGQFAKIPRAEDRFEELKATTVLNIEQPLPPHTGGYVRPAKEVKKSSVGGSISGKNISDEEIALIPAFEKMYEALGVQLRHDRYVVTPNDFAVFCLLSRFFMENMNADGTLPVRRFGAFWAELYADGTADRPFNFRRYKAIQEFLSVNRHISWVDNRYQRPEGEKKGIACKWRVTDHFCGLLDLAAEQGEAPFVVTQEFQFGTGEHKSPIPYLIEVEDDRKWWSWAVDRLENYEH